MIRRRVPRRVASVLLACASAVVSCRDVQPANVARASGFVEATEIRLAPEVGGKLLELGPHEGDRVAAGDLVARIDTSNSELQLERALADRDQAEAQLALLEAGSRIEEIRQAEAQAAASRTETEAARADAAAAELDLARAVDLLEASAGSRKDRDDAQTRVKMARERVQGAEARVRAADEVVARLRAGARRQEIEAARARVGSAAAAIKSLRKAIADAEVRAPASGVVTERLVEPGEIVAARTPLLVIVDLDHAWATLYVSEPTVPRLRIGQSVRVTTDARTESVDGQLTYVSPQAEFTPRNVQTAEERSKLVYRVKVTVDNRKGVLKQGMPVEAELPLEPVPPTDSR